MNFFMFSCSIVWTETFVRHFCSCVAVGSSPESSR